MCWAGPDSLRVKSRGKKFEQEPPISPFSCLAAFPQLARLASLPRSVELMSRTHMPSCQCLNSTSLTPVRISADPALDLSTESRCWRKSVPEARLRTRLPFVTSLDRLP